MLEGNVLTVQDGTGIGVGGMNLLKQLFDANVGGNVLRIAAECVDELLVQGMMRQLTTGRKGNRSWWTVYVDVRIVVVVAGFDLWTVISRRARSLNTECCWLLGFAIEAVIARSRSPTARVYIVVMILLRILLRMFLMGFLLGDLRGPSIDRGIEWDVLWFLRRFRFFLRFRLLSFLTFGRLGREKLIDSVGHKQGLKHIVA